MSTTDLPITRSLMSARVLVLVKALPQPSKRYGETVCCAGITIDGYWKRLYPIRFRHLGGEAAFQRWDWVEFQYRQANNDQRKESCHVFEDTLTKQSSVLSPIERARLLEPVIRGSALDATMRGESLALVRPKNTRFFWKRRNATELHQLREAFQRAARQTSMFDKPLAEMEPTPFDFRFSFVDASGKHDYQCGDWEIHAVFFNWRRKYGEKGTLERMSEVFNERFPRAGMAFALGNQAKRPQTWQLLGVLRLDEPQQFDFGF